MRKFVVWAFVRKETELDFPDEFTDNECERGCESALEDMISNGDTGWFEIKKTITKGDCDEAEE